MLDRTKSHTAEVAPEAGERKRLLIVEGVRENGGKFRPSDWVERISSTYAVFGKDQRLRYSQGVRPRVVGGKSVLAVELSLQEYNPDMFQEVMKFVRDNQLRVREELDSQD